MAEMKQATTANAPKKERAPALDWKGHPEWTDLIVDYLTNNPTFRQKLFSDSTKEASKAGRKKTVGGESKNKLFTELTTYIFADNPDHELATRFNANSAPFVASVVSRLQRYVIYSISRPCNY